MSNAIVHYRPNEWFHNVAGTLVVEMPSKKFVSRMQVGEIYEITVGFAKLNNKDQLCKKTGRTIAEKRLLPAIFELVKIEKMSDTRIHWSLVTKIKLLDPLSKPLIVHLQFSTSYLSKLVKLEQADVTT